MSESSVTETPDYDAAVAELGDPAAPLAVLNEALETTRSPRIVACLAVLDQGVCDGE